MHSVALNYVQQLTMGGAPDKKGFPHLNSKRGILDRPKIPRIDYDPRSTGWRLHEFNPTSVLSFLFRQEGNSIDGRGGKRGTKRRFEGVRR